MFETEKLFIEDSFRELAYNKAINKLYDNTVGKCNKCINGFVSGDKKITKVEDLSSSIAKKCSCYKLYEKYKQYIISGIPREFWSIKGQDLRIDQDSKNKLKIYIEKLNEVSDKGLGILFLGSEEGITKPNSGSGKTASGIQVLENAIESGKTAHYITMHSYFNLIYRSKDDDGIAYRDMVDEISNVDFLCIDEIGKINKTDFVYNKFEDMIRYRSSQMMVTLAITNMNEQELEEFVGPSLMDILKNISIKIILKGDSYRKDRFRDIKKLLKMEV